MMAALGAGDFPTFFKAVHSQEPFPWQKRLARQVVEERRWPSLLDLPTGAGKTAAIDIAVFHLACEAQRGTKRKAPMRILFVIDRRIVVDEASRRARKLADALQRATKGVLLRVKERLAQLSGDSSHPLDTVRLRGGMPQERDWARSPAQPLIAVSTVDQVGSRLLFRGYGVSSRMWPVHAGLVGADALWLLDEVHLSQPLAETLDAITAWHAVDGKGILADGPRLAPFSVVRLSATPGTHETDAFRLNAADWANDKLGPRLTASKIASQVEIREDLADAFADHALRFAGLAQQPPLAGRGKKRQGGTDNAVESVPDVHRVAVVVNRVNLARQVFERLRKTIGREHAGQADLILLTGRVRPLDRDCLLKRLGPLFASPERAVPARPVILVATQTVEVGADLDVDALVTEIAPLDALRQRFGRLDRLGLRRKSRATILVPAASADEWEALEGIYDASAKATAAWLKTLKGEIDFGIKAFRKHAITVDLLAPRPQAPALLPVYADLWATTSPEPAATPEPALFLHGPSKPLDAQIVWRADISPANEEWANLSLKICPPSSLEALSVPIWAVRKWLQQAEDAPFADVPEREPKVQEGQRGRPCLRRASERWALAYAEDLRPGDTIIVPCSYGGCDAYGWNPECREQVTDLGTEAHYRQRLKGALRVTEAVLANALVGNGGPSARETWQRAERTVLDEEDVGLESIRAALLAIDGLPETWAKLLKGVGPRGLKFVRIDEDDPSAGFAIWTERRLAAGLLDPTDEDEETAGSEAMTGYDDSSDIGVEVTLTAHLNRVEAKVRDLAERAGLPESLVAVIGLAGRMHDLGKADPRFQTDLWGASALARRDPMLAAMIVATREELLAKSARYAGAGPTPGAAPENFRHEALSVALAEKHPNVTRLTQEERDLLLWLIGAHHGHGRPFFPPANDDAPRTEARVPIDGVTLVAAAHEAPLRLDQGWFERAARVRRTYGPWELARLEAILRLADHCVSAEEQGASASGTPVKRSAKARS